MLLGCSIPVVDIGTDLQGCATRRRRQGASGTSICERLTTCSVLTRRQTKAYSPLLLP